MRPPELRCSVILHDGYILEYLPPFVYNITMTKYVTSLPSGVEPHPTLENIFVGRDGSVYSNRHRWGQYENKWRVLSPSPISKKYPYLRVTLGGRFNIPVKPYYIHRLVMETFSPTNDETLEVNHIDHDKTNNNLENLEWVTHGENMRALSQYMVDTRSQ